MCGIAGIISLNNSKINYDHLVLMTKELNRRGPDGEGYLISNNDEFAQAIKKNNNAKVSSIEHSQQIGLGHTRLAITDLADNASQPMVDATGRYWIVFNGQIFNYVELRKELEVKGFKFLTDHSDTEVILNAYSCWGEECFKKFNGMWAFCLWDTVENKILLSRDRIGKQPLCYTIVDNTLYFASELNALLKIKEIDRRLNERSVYNYLTYSNVPAPETIFKGFNKLQASHCLSFKPGDEIEPKKYWDPSSIVSSHVLNEDEVVHQIREKIFKSVHLRMMADVNVGILLSGGLDSSVILACMSQYSTKPIKTYTVGFENKNKYKNEISYARKVAALFKSDLSECVVTEKDFFDFLPKMAYYFDEPIADTANIPLYFVSELAH